MSVQPVLIDRDAKNTAIVHTLIPGFERIYTTKELCMLQMMAPGISQHVISGWTSANRFHKGLDISGSFIIEPTSELPDWWKNRQQPK